MQKLFAKKQRKIKYRKLTWKDDLKGWLYLIQVKTHGGYVQVREYIQDY